MPQRSPYGPACDGSRHIYQIVNHLACGLNGRELTPEQPVRAGGYLET